MKSANTSKNTNEKERETKIHEQNWMRKTNGTLYGKRSRLVDVHAMCMHSPYIDTQPCSCSTNLNFLTCVGSMEYGYENVFVQNMHIAQYIWV